MRLRYRSVVDGRDPLAYAPWVRALRGRHGVYVVRARKSSRRPCSSGEVLYVGESHSGRLYSTLTRHFQHWQGYTAGTTYDRDEVEVALAYLDQSPDEVVFGQVALIGELAPRDNAHHQLGLEDLEEDDLDGFEPDEFDGW